MKYRKSPTYAKALQETIQMHKQNVKKLSTSYQIRQAGLFGNATLIKKKFNSDSAQPCIIKNLCIFRLSVDLCRRERSGRNPCWEVDQIRALPGVPDHTHKQKIVTFLGLQLVGQLFSRSLSAFPWNL